MIKCKRTMSLLLALSMLCSLGMRVSATEHTEQSTESTQVIYTGEGYDGKLEGAYEITVPAKLAPGETGTVTVTGAWPTTKKLTVGADESVTLTCNLNLLDTKDLKITFDTMVLEGDNEKEQSHTGQIQIEEISDAIFGVWEGTFNYTVEFSDVSAE